MKKIIHSKGIGLLELMLTLAIIAVLLLTLTEYYGRTHSEMKINRTVGEIQAIHSASSRWWAMYHSIDSISMPELITRNLLPQKSNINVWGGTVSVAKSASHFIVIKFSDVPKTACYRLQRYFAENGSVKASACHVNEEEAENGEYQLIINAG